MRYDRSYGNRLIANQDTSTKEDKNNNTIGLNYYDGEDGDRVNMMDLDSCHGTIKYQAIEGLVNNARVPLVNASQWKVSKS